MSALLLDVGNTRLKAALWQGGELLPAEALAHGGDAAAAIAGLRFEAVREVWVSSVLGAAEDLRLEQALRARFGGEPRFARAQREHSGLVSAYAEPERLGVDRWLAMLGARRLHAGAVVVVSAGTALTADCVDADGRHLGGFIAPGLLTAQQAVLGATRFATRDQQARYEAGLGRDTEACVRQGALLSCVGAIERAAAQLADATRLITGGDAAVLGQHLQGWEHRPLLVLEGLLAWATD